MLIKFKLLIEFYCLGSQFIYIYMYINKERVNKEIHDNQTKWEKKTFQIQTPLNDHQNINMQPLQYKQKQQQTSHATYIIHDWEMTNVTPIQYDDIFSLKYKIYMHFFLSSIDDIELIKTTSNQDGKESFTVMTTE